MAHTITHFLSSFIDKLSSWKTQLLEQWPSITQGLQTTIILERIDNDRLLISVDSSAWLQEMYFLSDILLEKINTTLDKPRIKKLHFKYKSRNIKKEVYTTHLPLPRVVNDVLSARQYIILAAVQDKELQECLRLFLMRCKSNERSELLSTYTPGMYKF